MVVDIQQGARRFLSRCEDLLTWFLLAVNAYRTQFASSSLNETENETFNRVIDIIVSSIFHDGIRSKVTLSSTSVKVFIFTMI